MGGCRMLDCRQRPHANGHDHVENFCGKGKVVERAMVISSQEGDERQLQGSECQKGGLA